MCAIKSPITFCLKRCSTVYEATNSLANWNIVYMADWCVYFLSSLPVPWLMYSAVNSGAPYLVVSKGMLCSIFLLFLMLITVIVSIAVSGWKMSKALGISMLFLYVVFVTLAVLLEYQLIVCPATWTVVECNLFFVHACCRPKLHCFCLFLYQNVNWGTSNVCCLNMQWNLLCTSLLMSQLISLSPNHSINQPITQAIFPQWTFHCTMSWTLFVSRYGGENYKRAISSYVINALPVYNDAELLFPCR